MFVYIYCNCYLLNKIDNTSSINGVQGETIDLLYNLMQYYESNLLHMCKITWYTILHHDNFSFSVMLKMKINMAESDYFSIGMNVSCTNCHGQILSGEVMSYDHTKRLLALSIFFSLFYCLQIRLKGN